jgi:alpha-beta hydrolase superfamily lysophospholipase
MEFDRNLHAYIDVIVRKAPPEDRQNITIVFIHGAWHDARCWQKYFMPYFTEHGYDCHALSFRGHGRSQYYEKLRTFRIQDYVEDVYAALRDVHSPFFIAAHSMGGFTAQHFLGDLNLRKKPKGLILLAPVPISGIFRDILTLFKRKPLKVLKMILLLNPYYIVNDPKSVHDLLFSKDMAMSEIEEYFDMMQNESFFAFLDMVGLDLPKNMRLTTPSLILAAQNDVLVSRKQIEETAKIYNSDFLVIPDVAHDMMLDKNWELVAKEMVNWLQKIR